MVGGEPVRIIVSVDRVLVTTDHVVLEVPDDFPATGDDGTEQADRLEGYISAGALPDGFEEVRTRCNDLACTSVHVSHWHPA
jgi:hypothetical protein|tara:strand:- start:2190 stop:2435 length:246 start_codon:yes stop_codon:yes gene_type:complete